MSHNFTCRGSNKAIEIEGWFVNCVEDLGICLCLSKLKDEN